jgi:hypothetical protein
MQIVGDDDAVELAFAERPRGTFEVGFDDRHARVARKTLQSRHVDVDRGDRMTELPQVASVSPTSGCDIEDRPARTNERRESNDPGRGRRHAEATSATERGQRGR